MEGRDCVFEFDRTWDLSVPPAQLWSAVAVPRRYCQWWNWLERFEADEFKVGSDIPLVIKSPLWYRLHMTLHVDQLDPGRSMDATISGDLVGPASLLIRQTKQGCEVGIAWHFVLARPDLKLVARVGRPVLVWAHQQIVDSALADFEDRVLSPSA
jgi:hypothetical protein